MRPVLWFLLAIALAGFLSTFVVESGFAGRAVEVQPIARDPGSDTGWRLAGRPARFIDIPAAAFVTRGAPGIPPQVDVDRLRSAGVPIEQATAPVALARVGAALAAASLIFGLVAFRRRT